MSAASRDSDASDRDVMQYEVVIVGAGPAGLACAIRLKQLKPALQVCVLEKAAAVGAHVALRRVLEPGPLEQLLPEWRDEYPGMKVPATEDDFRILTPRGSFKPVPDWLVRLLPRSMTYSTPFNNHGNYIISLGQLTAWLASRAEALGVEVFAGFAAAAPLFDERGAVQGVRIGDMGRDKDGTPGPNFTPGVEIHAPLTVLAEGARGSIAKQLIARFDLGARALPADLRARLQGAVAAARGARAPGTHRARARLAGGRAHLRRQLPLPPRQRPRVRRLHRRSRLPGPAPRSRSRLSSSTRTTRASRRCSRAARSSRPGRAPSPPAAGNRRRRWRCPARSSSAMPAARSISPRSRACTRRSARARSPAEHVAGSGGGAGFDARWRASVGGQELKRVRNFKPAFKRGLWVGLLNAAWETLTAGRSPWTLRNSADWSRLKKLAAFTSPERHWVERTLPPRDRVSFVFFAGNAHEENQPVHLKVADTIICAQRCAQRIRQSLRALLPGRRSTRWSTMATAGGACRSTPPTACTARPATSRTRTRSSPGPRPKAARDRTTSRCSTMSELWRPPAARIADANLTRFMRGVNARRGTRAVGLRGAVRLVAGGAGGFLERAGTLRRRARRMGRGSGARESRS